MARREMIATITSTISLTTYNERQQTQEQGQAAVVEREMTAG
jgi:hypothetical protein